MTISIVIPVYNVQDYIKKCLDSILSQTFSDLEIILVDDGSTDLSGRICDYYSENDKRIKVIHTAMGDSRKQGTLESKMPHQNG